MGELQVADVRTQLSLSLFTDFENFSVFKPGGHHEKSVNAMLDVSDTISKRLLEQVLAAQQSFVFKNN